MQRFVLATLALLILLAPAARADEQQTSIATLMQDVANGVVEGAERQVGSDVMGWTLTSLGLESNPNSQIVAALDQIEVTLIAIENELADIEQILAQQSCQNAADVSAVQDALNAIDIWVGRGSAPAAGSYLALVNDAQLGVDVTSQMATLFNEVLNGNADFPPLQDLLVGLDNALRDQGNAEQLISACGLLIPPPSGEMDDRPYFDQLDGLVGYYAEYQARAALVLAEAYHWKALQAWLAAGNDPTSLQPQDVPLICNNATGEVLTYCVDAEDVFNNIRTNLRAQYGEAGAPYSSGKPTDPNATFEYDPSDPVVQMQNPTGYVWALDIDDFFAKGGYATSCQASTSKSPCGPGVAIYNYDGFAFQKYQSNQRLSYGANGGYTTWQPAPASAWASLTASWTGSSTTLGDLLTKTFGFASSATRPRVYFTGDVDSSGHRVGEPTGANGSGDVWYFDVTQAACFVATPMNKGNSPQPFCNQGFKNLMHGSRDHENSKYPCYNAVNTPHGTLDDADIESPFFEFLYTMQNYTCNSSSHPNPRTFYAGPPGWVIRFEVYLNEVGNYSPGEQVVKQPQFQYHWPVIDANAVTCTTEPATGALRSRYALNGRTKVPRLCGADFDAWFDKWVAPPPVVQAPPQIATPAPVVVEVPPGSTALLAQHEVTAVVDYADKVSALDPEDGPLPVSCFPASGTAFQLGTTEVRCQATDSAGATVERTLDVSVQYPFRFFGLFGSRRTARARGGRVIPVVFGLAGNRGLDVIAGGRPTSVEVDCESGETLGTPESAVSWKGLRYSRATGLYTYPWKTEGRWRGQCRDLIVALADGTHHVARIRFEAHGAAPPPHAWWKHRDRGADHRF